MKLIIAGSRTIKLKVYQLEDLVFMMCGDVVIEQLISGECEFGPDKTCTEMALKLEMTKENEGYKGFPADWKRLGKKAGHIRNAEMADYGTHLLLIWDGKSPGSKNMLAEMKKRKKPIYEVILRKHNETL